MNDEAAAAYLERDLAQSSVRREVREYRWMALPQLSEDWKGESNEETAVCFSARPAVSLPTEALAEKVPG